VDGRPSPACVSHASDMSTLHQPLPAPPPLLLLLVVLPLL
jgi:hypothetical protein